MKAVIIGALAATAYSATTYPGIYTVGTTSGAAAKCCFPTGDVKIVQPAGAGANPVTVEFKFDGATTCKTTALQNTAVSGGSAPDGSGDITITSGGKTYKLVLGAASDPLTLNLAAAATDGTEACLAPLTKKTLPTYTYQGLYSVGTKTGDTTKCCYPTGDIAVYQDATSKAVNLDWIFDPSCPTTALKGTEIESTAATPSTDVGDVYFTSGSGASQKSWTLEAPTTAAGTFTLNVAAGSTTGTEPCEFVLTPKTKATHSYNQVFEGDGEQGTVASCCYPAGDITTTQDATTKKVTVGWTFESDCGVTALQGKTINAPAATPDAVTGDVSIVDATTSKTYVLEYPSDATGAFRLDLSSIASGCALVLDDKSGYVLGLGSLVALSLSYIMF